MESDLHTRIESLEELCRVTLEEIRAARKELAEFREEQRRENVRTRALLQQLGARIGGVEGRVYAMEERLGAVETAVFEPAQEEPT